MTIMGILFVECAELAESFENDKEMVIYLSY